MKEEGTVTRFEVRLQRGRVPRILGRLSDLGTAAQATIPGLYAWAVTVAPAAWSRGSPLFAKIVALFGVTGLALAVFVEKRSATWARSVSVWGLVLTSALVWAVAPATLLPTRLDAGRGVAGMIGWALFALASAAPSLRQGNAGGRVVTGPPLRPRTLLARGDAAYLAAGIALAVALQLPGWRIAAPERALLVRVVALVSGLAVLGAAGSLAMARHHKRVSRSRKTRLRRSIPWIMLLVLLVLGGVIMFGLLRP
jgi:hypothetical protein